jgi:hypothetical protein
MFDENLASVCGIYCGNCEYFGKECAGCNNAKGKPFWTVSVKMDVCPLYDCSVNKKNLKHCGFCSELPCNSFLQLRDPSLSDEAFNESLKKRRDNLIKWKETGSFEIN